MDDQIPSPDIALANSESAQTDESNNRPNHENDDSISDIEIRDNNSSFGPENQNGTQTSDGSDTSFETHDYANDTDDAGNIDDIDGMDTEMSDETDSSDEESDENEARQGILRQTSAELTDITKLMQFEFSKNPLSTQQILSREAAGLFKYYGEHGSYLRLSENILNFLEKGDVVVRPTTRRYVVKETVMDRKTGLERTIEKGEEAMSGYDRARLVCAPIRRQHRSVSASDQSNRFRSDESKISQDSMEMRSLHTNGYLSAAPSLRVSTPSSDHGPTNQINSRNIVPNSPHEYHTSESDRSARQSETAHEKPVEKVSMAMTVKDLLPKEVQLNHNHPFTMTNDAGCHALLDPAHPQYLPFNPVDAKFTIRPNAEFAPGSLEAINNIYRLAHLNAQHHLTYLTTKYTPLATSSTPSPPAPPFALFRIGIQQLTQSNLSTLFNTLRSDPSGLPPSIRTLLKDLFDNHQGRKNSLSSLNTYYSTNESFRNDTWLLGSEHVTDASLNPIERQILSRIVGGGAIGGDLCAAWWDERYKDRRWWEFLRCWIREQDVKRVIEAKRDKRF